MKNMKEVNYVFIDLLKSNENKREGESLPRNKEINKNGKKVHKKTDKRRIKRNAQ